ncbi:helix-turn-helix domain-containing protein [Rhodococcus sp. ACT016]|uniref:helix-turn-helix domain-containing protein n=1 Tax=Rhodococcus sp. ACT016 TaxID=3134808 RepID=UPI003D2B66A2
MEENELNLRPPTDTRSASAESAIAWTDLLREWFVSVDILPAERDSCRGQVELKNLGQLSAAELTASGQSVLRTGRMASAESTQLFHVGLITEGTGQLTQDGRTCRLTKGDFAVYETARPFRWDFPGNWNVTVFTWNRDRIELADGESARLTARTMRGDSGLTGLLSRMLSGVVEQDVDVSAQNAMRFADELAALTVTVGLEQCAGNAEQPQPDQLLRILEFIEDNLSDPQLGPQTIASEFYISTRTLHRLFAGEGHTVAQWIRGRRLDRCRQALIARPTATISEIISRFGIADLAAFSRAFTARYGMSPTAFRAVAA